MDPTVSCCLAAIAVVIAVACAFRLTRMKNKLIATVRKISPYLAITLAVLSVFFFIMDDVVEYIGLGSFFIVIGIVVAALILIGHFFSICRRCLLKTDEKEKEEKKPGRKKRFGAGALTTLCTIDAISIAVAGFSLGVNFHINSGTGAVVAITLFFFIFLQLLTSIERMESVIPANAAKANILISLGAFLAAAIISHAVVIQNMLAICISIAIAAGYLMYLALWQFYFLAKTAKK